MDRFPPGRQWATRNPAEPVNDGRRPQCRRPWQDDVYPSAGTTVNWVTMPSAACGTPSGDGKKQTIV